MNPSLDKIVVLRKPQSASAEQYRKLFNNLETIDQQEGFKTLALASINTHLNKAKTLINLGILYAQNDQKTLLVDFNTRKADLSTLLNAKKHLSINDLIKKKENIIKNIEPIHAQLDLLPISVSEDISLNALTFKVLKEVLESLREKYDKILIDTPSLNDYSEGYMVAKASDATLLVLASRKTNSINAKAIVKELKENHIRVLGTVLTQVNPRELFGGYQLFNVKK
jgi:Mrp family chromosome partitioning ATPase